MGSVSWKALACQSSIEPHDTRLLHNVPSHYCHSESLIAPGAKRRGKTRERCPKIPSPEWARVIKKDDPQRLFFMDEGARRGMNIPAQAGIQEGKAVPWTGI